MMKKGSNCYDPLMPIMSQVEPRFGLSSVDPKFGLKITNDRMQIYYTEVPCKQDRCI